MRQLMKNQRRQTLIAPAEHGVEDRVVEPTQSGIGLNATDKHISALLARKGRFASCAALTVIAPVSHTSGNREAMGNGRE